MENRVTTVHLFYLPSRRGCAYNSLFFMSFLDAIGLKEALGVLRTTIHASTKGFHQSGRVAAKCDWEEEAAAEFSVETIYDQVVENPSVFGV
jgi:hypothetical protein